MMDDLRKAEMEKAMEGNGMVGQRLLSETDIQEAEALGKAMRFGAMFSIGDPSQAGTLRWNPKKRQLSLALTEEGLGLFGEVAQARFVALAQALKAQSNVALTEPSA